jgi:hypothetical protein
LISYNLPHSIDDSGGGALRGMDVSIRGSSWKSSSSFGYDDTFTLNTSEHSEDQVDEEEAAVEDMGKNHFRFQAPVHAHSSEEHQCLEEEEGEGSEFTWSISDLTTSPVETVLKAPLYFLDRTTHVFQNMILGVENIRVNENQVASMMLLQRSSMQRSDDNPGLGAEQPPFSGHKI